MYTERNTVKDVEDGRRAEKRLEEGDRGGTALSCPALHSLKDHRHAITRQELSCITPD